MKTIEQNKTSNIAIDIRDKESIACLFQCGDEVVIDKNGAAELIKVLQEWIRND